VTGPRLVVSLFGQGRWRSAARHVLGPVLVAGRGRGRERGGQGRFVGGSHSRGTARGTEQDPSAQQGPVPGRVAHRSIRNVDHRAERSPQRGEGEASWAAPWSPGGGGELC